MSAGWIGIAFATLAAGLSIRKRMAYQGVGRMSTWKSVHVYAGIVAAFAIWWTVRSIRKRHINGED